jgi:hypothetical protein
LIQSAKVISEQGEINQPYVRLSKEAGGYRIAGDVGSIHVKAFQYS